MVAVTDLVVVLDALNRRRIEADTFEGQVITEPVTDSGGMLQAQHQPVLDGQSRESVPPPRVVWPLVATFYHKSVLGDPLEYSLGTQAGLHQVLSCPGAGFATVSNWPWERKHTGICPGRETLTH